MRGPSEEARTHLAHAGIREDVYATHSGATAARGQGEVSQRNGRSWWSTGRNSKGSSKVGLTDCSARCSNSIFPSSGPARRRTSSDFSIATSAA